MWDAIKREGIAADGASGPWTQTIERCHHLSASSITSYAKINKNNTADVAMSSTLISLKRFCGLINFYKKSLSFKRPFLMYISNSSLFLCINNNDPTFLNEFFCKVKNKVKNNGIYHANSKLQSLIVLVIPMRSKYFGAVLCQFHI